MSNQELNERIQAIRSQKREYTFLIDGLKHEQGNKTKEKEVLEAQLLKTVRLPYLVATVTEVKCDNLNH